MVLVVVVVVGVGVLHAAGEDGVEHADECPPPSNSIDSLEQVERLSLRVACREVVARDLDARVVNVMELDPERHQGERPPNGEESVAVKACVDAAPPFLGNPVRSVDLVLQMEQQV